MLFSNQFHATTVLPLLKRALRTIEETGVIQSLSEHFGQPWSSCFCRGSNCGTSSTYL